MWENVQEQQTKVKKWSDHISTVNILNWIIIIIILVVHECVYTHAFILVLACLLNDFNLASFSLITCVHRTYLTGEEEKKNFDLELLYWSFSLDTIWSRSCETNLLKRVKKKERKRSENLHTSNVHFFY
jgi:hypothetical protein